MTHFITLCRKSHTLIWNAFQAFQVFKKVHAIRFISKWTSINPWSLDCLQFGRKFPIMKYVGHSLDLSHVYTRSPAYPLISSKSLLRRTAGTHTKKKRKALSIGCRLHKNVCWFDCEYGIPYEDLHHYSVHSANRPKRKKRKRKRTANISLGNSKFPEEWSEQNDNAI